MQAGSGPGEKVRLGLSQQSRRFPPFVASPPLFASPTGETMADGNRGAEFQVGVLFPASKYSRCRLCYSEVLRPARLPLAVPLCRTCTPGLCVSGFVYTKTHPHCIGCGPNRLYPHAVKSRTIEHFTSCKCNPVFVFQWIIRS